MKQTKTIDYYLALPYKLEIIPDTIEGVYGARYLELPDCITAAKHWILLPATMLSTLHKYNF